MYAVNWVDVIILVAVSFYVYYRYDRGLIPHLFVLAGLVLMLPVALLAYPVLSRFMIDQQGIFRNIANAGAFVALFTGGQLGYLALLSPYAADADGKIKKRFPLLKKVDNPLGILPAIFSGLIVASVALSIFVAIPVSDRVKTGVAHSYIGGRLFAFSIKTAGNVESGIGRPAGERIVFVVPAEKREEAKEEKVFIPRVSAHLDFVSGDEQEMLYLINIERKDKGLKPLVIDKNIRSIARWHSNEMWSLRYFAHDSPVSGSPFERLKNGGVRFDAAGENIALAPDVHTAHQGFMNSPSHRKNILNPDFRKVGIGVVGAGINGEMFTQDFTD